mmetsp:Transcript_13606/g.29983  ORF Transcript_13606/g.29983 Transcript_13606/m.29983 type:complete len:788 (+) Transcript_13606:32-2395(+)
MALLVFFVLGALVQQGSSDSARGTANRFADQRVKVLGETQLALDDAEQTNPVQRVVALLEKMGQQLAAEAQSDSEMYEQMVCWCQKNEAQKSKAAADAEMAMRGLESGISGYASQQGELSASIASIKEEISGNQAALETAAAIREREASAFSQSEKEMLQAVTNLKNAIAVLAKHQGGVSSLLQTDAPQLASVRAVLRDVALKYQLMLGDAPLLKQHVVHSGASLLAIGTGSAERSDLAEAIEGLLESDVQDGPGAQLPLDLAQRALSRAAQELPKVATGFLQATGEQPIFQSRAAQSSEIFGILTRMKDEFEANLSQEQKDELKAKEQFEAMAASKKEQIALLKEQLDNHEEQRADNGKALSDAKEDLELTRKQRSADVEFLRNLKLTCQNLDKEWSERSSTRVEERKAVAEALAILKEDENQAHLHATVSFLQESASSDSSSLARLLQSRAVQSLRKSALSPNFDADDLLNAWHGRHGALPAVGGAGGPHAQLSMLAVALGLDNLKDVQATMDKMVSHLKVQQKEEVAFKDHCEGELAENEKSIYAKTEERGELESKMDGLSKTVSMLEEQIAEAMSQVADTKKQVLRASEVREEENTVFQKSVSDQRSTQDILKKALARLKAFYESKAKAKALLLQAKSQGLQTPPVQFNKYKDNSNASPVMGLLEQIIQDSVSLEAEVVTAEQEAQASYESFVKNSNAVMAELRGKVEADSKRVASAKMEAEAAKGEHTSAQGELESLAEYKADLHMECDFLLKNFAIRQKARLEEMEAIQQAQAIMAGAAAF